MRFDVTLSSASSKLLRQKKKLPIGSNFNFLHLAGAKGLEPLNAGTKTRCLTTWRRPIAPTYCIIKTAFLLYYTYEHSH